MQSCCLSRLKSAILKESYYECFSQFPSDLEGYMEEIEWNKNV